MKALYIVLRTLGYIWIIAGGLLIFAGLFGIWMKEGFSGVAETVNPFNLANSFLTLLTLAPGFCLLAIAGKVKVKASNQQTN